MRIVNRIASTILALVLIAGGLLIVVQTIGALASRPWPIPASWRATLQSTTISDRTVLVTSIVVGLVGLIAFVAQLLPRRQQRLPAAVEGTAVDAPTWWVSRRSVERRSSDAAAQGAGVQHARVMVRGRPQQWQVRISGEAAPHHYDAAEQSVRDELAALGAPPDVTVSRSLRTLGRVA